MSAPEPRRRPPPPPPPPPPRAGRSADGRTGDGGGHLGARAARSGALHVGSAGKQRPASEVRRAPATFIHDFSHSRGGARRHVTGLASGGGRLSRRTPPAVSAPGRPWTSGGRRPAAHRSLTGARGPDRGRAPTGYSYTPDCAHEQACPQRHSRAGL